MIIQFTFSEVYHIVEPFNGYSVYHEESGNVLLSILSSIYNGYDHTPINKQTTALVRVINKTQRIFKNL